MHASCWSCPSSHLAQDGLCWLVLTKLSSSSLILRSLPAAIMVFMSGVTATPLRAENVQVQPAQKWSAANVLTLLVYWAIA